MSRKRTNMQPGGLRLAGVMGAASPGVVVCASYGDVKSFAAPCAILARSTSELTASVAPGKVIEESRQPPQTVTVRLDLEAVQRAVDHREVNSDLTAAQA